MRWAKKKAAQRISVREVTCDSQAIFMSRESKRCHGSWQSTSPVRWDGQAETQAGRGSFSLSQAPVYLVAIQQVSFSPDRLLYLDLGESRVAQASFSFLQVEG